MCVKLEVLTRMITLLLEFYFVPQLSSLFSNRRAVMGIFVIFTNFSGRGDAFISQPSVLYFLVTIVLPLPVACLCQILLWRLRQHAHFVANRQ